MNMINLIRAHPEIDPYSDLTPELSEFIENRLSTASAKMGNAVDVLELFVDKGNVHASLGDY